MHTNSLKFITRPNDLVLSCRNNNGSLILGRVAEITNRGASLEVYGGGHSLSLSETLNPLIIKLNGDEIFKGPVTIRGLVTTGHSMHCEVTFDHLKLDLDEHGLNDAEGFLEQYPALFKSWQDQLRISSPFKAAVADLQTYLKDLYAWLMQLEGHQDAGISPQSVMLGKRPNFVFRIENTVLATLNELFDRFERFMAELDEHELQRYRRYTRCQLHSLTLCAPFVSRTFFKPLGYAGDYEMVNMMVRNGYEGDSLYAILLNRWFLNQAPAIAHRNRICFLTQRLVDESVRVSSENRGLRVLNLGCGPAHEIQQFLRASELSDQAEFTLLDFNEETIAHVESQLTSIKKSANRRTMFHFQKKAVQQILRESGKAAKRTVERQHDFVYCAGLFDYLTDAICQHMIGIMYSWLAPGGLLLLTNVDQSNPRRHTMESLLEWNLIYRNSAQASRILPPEIPDDAATIHTELSGVNVVIEIRKPRHA